MKKRNWSYLFLYIFSFGGLGAFLPLLGQYLKLNGFTGTQIGTITSAGTAAAIFATTFWGRLYNSSANKKRFILKLIIAAALFCASLYFVHSYILFLVLFCGLYSFQAPAMALVDAMTIEDGQVFGAARKWGAVGFALGVFFAGKVSEITGLHVIFFIYTGCFIIFAGIVCVMSAGNRGKIPTYSEKPDSLAKTDIYKNKRYIKLVICAFFINGTVVAHNTYFGFLFVHGGGSIAGIGLAFLLMAGSEAPFMAFAGKLSGAFTLEKTLFAAICLSAIRFAWYSTYPSAHLLLFMFFLQGMSTGIALVEFVRYVAKIVDGTDLGIAISAYYAFGSSLSTIFCQLAGGIILDRFNAGGVYGFFSGMNLLGAFLYLFWKLYK